MVYIHTGSALLSSVDETYLASLRHLLTGDRQVVCNGYTDSRDTSAYNLALGKQRAAAACGYLVKGVHMKIKPHSYGSARPQADNGTPAGQARNRRAEIYLRY